MSKGEQGIVTGPVPISDVQILYLDRAWADYDFPEYTEHKFPAADEYVTWQVFAVREDLRQEVLEQGVKKLLLYHAGLRLRLEKRDGKWLQYIAPPDAATPVVWLDLSDLARDERQAISKSTLVRESHSLSLKHGPVVKFVYFKLGTYPPGQRRSRVYPLIQGRNELSLYLSVSGPAKRYLRSGRAQGEGRCHRAA